MTRRHIAAAYAVLAVGLYSGFRSSSFAEASADMSCAKASAFAEASADKSVDSIRDGSLLITRSLKINS